MKRRVLHALALAPILFAAACAAANAGDEQSGSSEGALHETLGHARACAAVRAFENAELEDFDTPSRSQIPPNVAVLSEHDIAHLDVKGVGDVYEIDAIDAVCLYDRSANLLACGDPTTGTWVASGGAALTCTGGGSSATDGGTEGGWWSSSSSSTGGWNGGWDNDAGDAG